MSSACLTGRIRSGWRDDHAAQLVEFAVSLPLLVLFVVGIFDFSNAFTLKQKLTNVARDAARTAAAEPSSDLQSALPMSVVDAFQDIDNYLLANNLSDCGCRLSRSSRTTINAGVEVPRNRLRAVPPEGSPSSSTEATFSPRAVHLP